MTPNASDEAINAAAAVLRRVYSTGEPCAPISDTFPGQTPPTAYAIQEVNTRKWLAEGRRLLGRKIGLTSKAVQEQLGVDQPDYGMLFADMEVNDGAEADMSRLVQPKIEAEIALVLERDLDSHCSSMADVIAATAYALPALEIVDSRIRNWEISIVDTIADNASSGLFVLGRTARKLDKLYSLTASNPITTWILSMESLPPSSLNNSGRSIIWRAVLRVRVKRQNFIEEKSDE